LRRCHCCKARRCVDARGSRLSWMLSRCWLMSSPRQLLAHFSCAGHVVPQRVRESFFLRIVITSSLSLHSGRLCRCKTMAVSGFTSQVRCRRCSRRHGTKRASLLRFNTTTTQINARTRRLSPSSPALFSILVPRPCSACRSWLVGGVELSCPGGCFVLDRKRRISGVEH
jgi:hypothetical protein